MKDNQIRFSETLPGNDPSIGRRMSGGDSHWNKTAMLHGFKNGPVKYSACKGMHIGKRHEWLPKHVRSIAFMFVLMGFFFLLDSLMVSIFHSMNLHNSSTSGKSSGIEEDTGTAYEDKQESQVQMYDRLLNLASNALAEICNAVAVASLLNATLVLPKFLYSNITDADITKEAKPIEYVKKVLPLLLRNGVVHFLGFGNRLGFDPLPFKLQRLRCKCNFHALKFAPKFNKLVHC